MHNHSYTSRRVSFVLAAAALCFIEGCGGDSGPERPTVAPVKGTVNYQGQPLAGATVSFYGPGSGVPSTGVSNEQGVFELTTYEQGDGAPIGENTVTVTKFEGGADSTSAGDPMQIIQGGAPPTTAGTPPPLKALVPEHYGNTVTTPLKVTVEEGKENTPTLNLD